jgi:hypothetical protein
MAVGALHMHRHGSKQSGNNLIAKALKSYQASVNIVREELYAARSMDVASLVSTTLILGLFEVRNALYLTKNGDS